MKKTTKKTKKITPLERIAIALEAIAGKLEAKAEPKVVPSKFPLWKTITLGSFKTMEDLKESITDQGMYIGSWASNLLDKTNLSPKASELDLAVVSVSDLGFPNGATYAEICKAAVDQGLELCPAEAGPLLRNSYTDQPTGEWLRIGMEAITGSRGDRYVFYVARGGDGEAWLDYGSGRPDYRWLGDCRFVFLKPKK